MIVLGGAENGIYNQYYENDGTPKLNRHNGTSWVPWKMENVMVMVDNKRTASKRTLVEVSAKFGRDFAKRQEFTAICQDKIATTVALQADLDAAIADFGKFAGPNLREFTGNIFSVHGHMVVFGCDFTSAFGKPIAHISSDLVARFMFLIDTQCGKSAGGFFNFQETAKVKPSYGRTPTDTPFCGGGGVKFGTTSHF